MPGDFCWCLGGWDAPRGAVFAVTGSSPLSHPGTPLPRLCTTCSSSGCCWGSMSGWLPGNPTVPWALWISMGLRSFFMFFCYGLGSEGMCSSQPWSFLLMTPVKTCVSQRMLTPMQYRAMHPRVDLFFFMLLHSLSHLLLFSLVSKPGWELANQTEDDLTCWGSFTLTRTSSSAQPVQHLQGATASRALEGMIPFCLHRIWGWTAWSSSALTLPTSTSSGSSARLSLPRRKWVEPRGIHTTLRQHAWNELGHPQSILHWGTGSWMVFLSNIHEILVQIAAQAIN